MRSDLADKFGIEYPIFGFTPSEHVAAAISRAASPLQTTPRSTSPLSRGVFGLSESNTFTSLTLNDGAAGSARLVLSGSSAQAVTGTIDGVKVAAQVRPILNGVALGHAGAYANAHVYTQREAELAALMPEKVAADVLEKIRKAREP